MLKIVAASKTISGSRAQKEASLAALLKEFEAKLNSRDVVRVIQAFKSEFDGEDLLVGIVETK